MISILNNLLVNNHSTLEKLCYLQTSNRKFNLYDIIQVLKVH